MVSTNLPKTHKSPGCGIHAQFIPIHHRIHPISSCHIESHRIKSFALVVNHLFCPSNLFANSSQTQPSSHPTTLKSTPSREQAKRRKQEKKSKIIFPTIIFFVVVKRLQTSHRNRHNSTQTQPTQRHKDDRFHDWQTHSLLVVNFSPLFCRQPDQDAAVRLLDLVLQSYRSSDSEQFSHRLPSKRRSLGTRSPSS